MRLQDTNWMTVENYLTRDQRLIIPLGSTEQHGYLSLSTDSLIVEKIAEAIAERTHVLIAPTLQFSVTSVFAEFPGTYGMSRATFDALIGDLVQSMMWQGFNQLIFINGHRDNLPPAILDVLKLEGMIDYVWFDWWECEAVRQFEAEKQLQIDHANWYEAFPFNRVAELPADSKSPVNLDYLEQGYDLRTLVGDGSMGGPYALDISQMSDLFFRIISEASLYVERVRVK